LFESVRRRKIVFGPVRKTNAKRTLRKIPNS
jgi:hypothetical protein